MTSPTPTPSPARTRVLVVDDHPGMADTLARAVSQLGPEIEAIPAMRGKQALEIVNQSPVDILITDLMMPDMTGLQLIEALQSHPAGRPTYIILITAYDVPGLKETARRLKLNETVIKPFRPEKISQIVSRALEEMGRSQPNQGTTIARQPFKILIADDVPDNIALLARYLQNEGCDFVSAANGIEALEKARSENPDLILLDINMPEMDGFEVLKKIRADESLAHLPVIFLTAARPDPLDVQTGLNLGADDYVIKPFDRRELMARIHTKLRVKESEDAIRRRNHEMNVMLEIVNISSYNRPLDEQLDMVLGALVAGMGAISGYLLDPEKSVIRSHTRSLREMEPARMRELAVQLNQAGKPIILEDVHSPRHWLADWDANIHAAAAVAVTDRLGGLLYTVLLTHEQPGFFNPEHMTLMQAVANQIAMAVDRARLYASLQVEKARD